MGSRPHLVPEGQQRPATRKDSRDAPLPLLLWARTSSRFPPVGDTCSAAARVLVARGCFGVADRGSGHVAGLLVERRSRRPAAASGTAPSGRMQERPRSGRTLDAHGLDHRLAVNALARSLASAYSRAWRQLAPGRGSSRQRRWAACRDRRLADRPYRSNWGVSRAPVATSVCARPAVQPLLDEPKRGSGRSLSRPLRHRRSSHWHELAGSGCLSSSKGVWDLSTGMLACATAISAAAVTRAVSRPMRQPRPGAHIDLSVRTSAVCRERRQRRQC